MRVSAIVVAAGRGKRLESKISKPLIKINNRPLISFCLEVLNASGKISEIILVANRGNYRPLRTLIPGFRKLKKVILGGIKRQDSVACGLRRTSPDTSLVLIHDAARPFIDRKIVSRLLKAAEKYGAAITGMPVKDTIKEADQCTVHSDQCTVTVKKTLNRNRLWEIQTPQVFRKDLIRQAYRKFGKCKVTDDAMLVEKLGKKVYIVAGSYNNIKITTPEDLVIARAIAGKWKTA